MSDMPWIRVREGTLMLSVWRTNDSVPIGDEGWRQWLTAPETTSFHFEDDGASFTARRELRRSRVYWYAYRRRGPRLAKVYMGRSDEIDLDRLCVTAARLSSTAPSGRRAAKSKAAPARGIEASYVSHLPAPATSLLGREHDVAMVTERLH